MRGHSFPWKPIYTSFIPLSVCILKYIRPHCPLKIFDVLIDICPFVVANENRYEGSWKEDKKHGDGKFYFLDSGQLYIGTWVNDIPKCGTCEEFGKETATNPSPYPLPEVRFVVRSMTGLFV